MRVKGRRQEIKGKAGERRGGERRGEERRGEDTEGVRPLP